MLSRVVWAVAHTHVRSTEARLAADGQFTGARFARYCSVCPQLKLRRLTSPELPFRVRLVLVVLATCVVAGACDRSPARQQASSAPVHQQTDADSASLAQARATAGMRYAAHWRTDQAFSVDTLRAREAWFTPILYELLLTDMPGGDIGVVDYDPFSDAQDSAQRFTLGQPRANHDTVYVPVDVQFDSTSELHRNVTLAMVRGAAGWQIGDFIDGNGSLVAELRKDPPQSTKTPAASKDTSSH